MAFASGISTNDTLSVYGNDGNKMSEKTQVRTDDLGKKYQWDNSFSLSDLATTVTSDKKNISQQIVSDSKIKNINYELANIWLEHTIAILRTNDQSWLGKTIQKSERYLLTLYDNREYRLFISNYLLIVRNNTSKLESSQKTMQQLANLLNRYMKSNRSPIERMKFIRETRTMGLSISGV